MTDNSNSLLSREDSIAFYKKYAVLSNLVHEYGFKKDLIMGSGQRQKSYANTQQYKVAFMELCTKAGLLFEASFFNAKTENALMPTYDGNKTIFLSQVEAQFVLTDPDTGFSKSFRSTGTSKNEAADHAALGAQTYCFRGWFLMTFLLNNEHDAKYETEAFMTEEQKSETKPKRTMKQKSSKTEQFAPQAMVDDIGKKLGKLREVNPDAGNKFLSEFGTVADDGSFEITHEEIPYHRAVSILQTIEEKLGEK